MAKRFFLLGILVTLYTKSLYANDPTRIRILAPEDFHDQNKHLTLTFTNRITKGPCNAYCLIAQDDIPIMDKDSDGNFLKFFVTKGHHYSLYDTFNSIEKFPFQFGILHTFALTSYLLDLNKQDSLAIQDICPEALQNWEKFTPLHIYPYADLTDTHKISSSGEFHLGKIEKDDLTKTPLWLSRSYEGVAFLTGHSLLMRHCPHFGKDNPIEEALLLSYGDLTAIFGLFSLDSLRNLCLQKAASDFHNTTSILPIAIEKFFPLEKQLSLRKGYEDIHLSAVSEDDTLNVSKVFTAAVYDALIESFQISAIGTHQESKSNLLKMISIQLRQLLLAALIKTPALNLSLKNVAETMISIARNNTQYEDFAPFLDLGFKQRGILIETPRENLSSDASLYTPFIVTHPISLIASGEE